MRRRSLIILTFVVLLTAFAAWLILPSGGATLNREDFVLGLDLRGGAHLLVLADLSGRTAAEAEDAMQGTTRIIEQHVDTYGVTEPMVQRQGSDRILVQLPGVKDIDEAIKHIIRTGQLNFRELELDDTGNPVLNEEGNPKWIPSTATGSDGEEKHLTGLYFEPNAYVDLNQQTMEPSIAFEFNDEGAMLFEQITQRNLGKPLGIFLGEEKISSPIVQAKISSRGIITGLTMDEAQALAPQLNAGAYPVPLDIIEQYYVDPTLGQDFLQRSIKAGLIGLTLVLLFMILYYRLPGLLASVALVMYGILVLAIFKTIPVTLTLSGIGGFILSIGMAVDANILIFERMKEEIAEGRTLIAAIEAGFNRAWTSIRDSNISTFVVCAILYWLGSELGASPVVGFAAALFIGVATSMFSAIVITRTFLRLFAITGMAKNKSLYSA